MNFRVRYGKLDRALHRIAFRSNRAQHALSDVMDILYRDKLADVSVERPVFISALPRSGTTMLLNLLWHTSCFASHTYEDMPFVMCPLLWSRYSRFFAGEVEATERAHGDGLDVSGRSPEAFEETVWKYFWPGHYEDDRIQPWKPGEKNSEFDSFFEMHMRKVVVARQAQTGGNGRYVSKNNLNIARLAALPEPLQRGTFLIPFRDPVQHAASMHLQHNRFLKIHDEDDFVREYMEAIGHHEFGKGLRPVNFENWLEDASDAGGLTFWVRYWISAYNFILKHAGDSAFLISYARLTDQPESSLSRLADILDAPRDRLVPQAGRLHPPREHAVDLQELPDHLLQEAYSVYDMLDKRASV